MRREKIQLRSEGIRSTTSELARDLGRRLRYLRAQIGVTQKELSNKAAIGRAHLSKLERGKILPGYLTLGRLAAAIGVDPARLVHGAINCSCDASQNSKGANVP